MSDYLKLVDLNPTINGGIARIDQPFDSRAMHYFGFTSDGQEIRNMSGFRIFASFQYANQPAQFLPAMFPVADLVIDPGETARYDELHERAHVLVWLDPAGIPPLGTAVTVRVRAWKRS